MADAADGSNDGCNVAANESNDVPDRYYDVLDSSNNAVDGLDDHEPISLLTVSAHGGIDVDKSVPALESPPTSVSEDTNTLKTSLSGP